MTFLIILDTHFDILSKEMYSIKCVFTTDVLLVHIEGFSIVIQIP